MFTIPIATAVAIFRLPPDLSGRGALMWPSWILTAGLLGGLAIDLLERGIHRIFRAELVLMIAIILIVYPEPLQSSYVTYLDAETVQKAFTAIGVFATLVALGASVSSLDLSRAVVELAQRQYSRRLIFRIMLLCWALAMLNFLYASNFSLTNIINGLLAGRWSAPWSRGQFGGWDAFRDFLNNFGYLVPTFTAVLALQSGSWLNPTVLVGLLLSAIDIAFIAQGGGRRMLVYVIGAATLTWLCAKRQHLRLEHYVIVAILVIANVVLLDIILHQRNVGFGEFSYQQEDFTGLRVDNNFRTLAETLRLIPTEAPFVGFQHLWYVVVRPIPRVFWEGKPVGSGFDLAQHLGERGVALSMSAIGELYMSFGWTGIVVGGFVFGWLARYWSQILDSGYGVTATALYGLGTMALFLGMRSLLELVLITYPILCWYALDRFFWRWMRGRAKQSHRSAMAQQVAG